jgi:hypothetical protein
VVVGGDDEDEDKDDDNDDTVVVVDDDDDDGDAGGGGDDDFVLAVELSDCLDFMSLSQMGLLVRAAVAVFLLRCSSFSRSFFCTSGVLAGITVFCRFWPLSDWDPSHGPSGAFVSLSPLLTTSLTLRFWLIPCDREFREYQDSTHNVKMTRVNPGQEYLQGLSARARKT